MNHSYAHYWMMKLRWAICEEHAIEKSIETLHSVLYMFIFSLV